MPGKNEQIRPSRANGGGTREIGTPLEQVCGDAWTQVDLSGSLTAFNEAFADLIGYSRAELMGLDYRMITPEKWHLMERDLIKRQAFSRGYTEIYEKEYRRKDGSIIPVELRTFLVRNAYGRAAGLAAIVRDISERKQVEEQLRQSEEKFSRAFHLSPDAVNINRVADGVYLAVNLGFERITGYSAADVIGRSSLPGDLGLWVAEQDRLKLVDGLRAEGEVREMEFPFRMKNGEIRMGSMSARILPFAGESCILSVTRDITDRKRTETSHREIEERMRAIIEGTPHLFFYTQDGDANSTYVSPTVETITGYSPEAWLRQRDWFVTDSPMNDAAKAATRANLRGESSPGPVRVEVRHRDGRPRLLEVYEHPIVSDGRIVGLQGVAHDVTERVQAESAMHRSLMEKEVLLKEVHHRVKNNLQIISSLLSIQATEAPDERIAAALQDARTRIRSMALVHERLYKASDFSQVNLLRYTEELASSLSLSSSRPEIELSVEGMEVHVGVDVAIPCGLILNELLTNALKHAFAGKTHGRVKAYVGHAGDHEMLLSVEDDGVGIPEAIDFTRPATLGMVLITQLVDQIRGTISISRLAGSRIEIRFPV